jgi:hypothetical protein
LGGTREASEVADLQAQHERGQGIDAAEAAQTGDRRPPLALAGEPGQPLVQRRLTGDQTVDSSQRVHKRELGDRLVESLTGQPLPVPRVPRRRFRVDAAVQQQQLGDAVAAAHQI